MSSQDSLTERAEDREPSSEDSLSRREACKRLGLIGAAILLGGCESLPRLAFQSRPGETNTDPAVLTPDQFAEKVGTVETARAYAVRGIEAPTEFIQRFLLYSPRIQAASRPGGPIGSVLYNPKPAAIASAVKLQLARGRGEPELLHDDLGTIAAAQYTQYGAKTFVAVFPNSVSIVGDTIHKDRSLLQLVLTGNLPSEKIVCVNHDLESLIGRQLTFASQMVHGIRCGTRMLLIRSAAIWTGAQERIPEDTISLSLATVLIRLETTGHEVRAITPEDPRKRPTGWQDVSEAYRNFAVGQMLEAEQALAQYAPRNTFEKLVVSAVLGEYRPYTADIRQRLDWGHTCIKVYSDQKQDGRADLLTQPVFVHGVGARKQL